MPYLLPVKGPASDGRLPRSGLNRGREVVLKVELKLDGIATIRIMVTMRSGKPLSDADFATESEAETTHLGLLLTPSSLEQSIRRLVGNLIRRRQVPWTCLLGAFGGLVT